MTRTMDFKGALRDRRDVMMDEFNPNVEPEGEWATFIPRWRGAFHIHRSRAAALRAAHPRFARSAILYRRQPGGTLVWVEVSRHDQRDDPPDRCDLCGHVPQDIFDALVRRWVKEERKVVDPPRAAWMCENCRQ